MSHGKHTADPNTTLKDSIKSAGREEDGNKNSKRRGDHNTKANRKAAESTSSRISELRKRHAEHLLEVVTKAGKREEERQWKLNHATGKVNAAYLQKRFEVERRRDQARISGLVRDARAVERAMLQQMSWNAKSEPANGTHTIVAGSTRSNASFEPSKVPSDSDFTAMGQMQFMKDVFQAVDDQKKERTRVRLAGQLAATERPERGLAGASAHDTSRKKSTSKPSLCIAAEKRGRSGNMETVAMLGNGRPSFREHGRRRLLEQKRGILMELKGLVSRQVDALDRLVGGCGLRFASIAGTDTCVAAKARKGRIVGSIGCNRTLEGIAPEVDGQARVRTSSSKLSTLSSSFTSTCPTTTCHAYSSSSNRSKQLRLLPPPPEENAVSGFLARGGRWESAKGGEVGLRLKTERRSSIASSASYASYGGLGRAGGAVAVRTTGDCEEFYWVPRKVPPLPIRRSSHASVL